MRTPRLATAPSPLDRLRRAFEAPLRRAGQAPSMRPIVDRIKQEVEGPIAADRLLAIARAASLAQSARDRRPPADMEEAYWAAAIAATEEPITIQGLPPGADKAKHFLVSGALSLHLSRMARWLGLGERSAAAIGWRSSLAIGYLKEAVDLLTSAGFSREDLAADRAGARHPFEPRS